jgi:hypothetical protein
LADEALSGQRRRCLLGSLARLVRPNAHSVHHASAGRHIGYIRCMAVTRHAVRQAPCVLFLAEAAELHHPAAATAGYRRRGSSRRLGSTDGLRLPGLCHPRLCSSSYLIGSRRGRHWCRRSVGGRLTRILGLGFRAWRRRGGGLPHFLGAGLGRQGPARLWIDGGRAVALVEMNGPGSQRERLFGHRQLQGSGLAFRWLRRTVKDPGDQPGANTHEHHCADESFLQTSVHGAGRSLLVGCGV